LSFQYNKSIFTLFIYSFSLIENQMWLWNNINKFDSDWIIYLGNSHRVTVEMFFNWNANKKFNIEFAWFIEVSVTHDIHIHLCNQKGPSDSLSIRFLWFKIPWLKKVLFLLKSFGFLNWKSNRRDYSLIINLNTNHK